MATRAEAAEERSENGSTGLPDCDGLEQSTFEQILEMDDDEDEREFSRSIVYGFFEQAEATFRKMEVLLQKGDLVQLSAEGHFLKGSSATLGLSKVKDSCEKIQHFGQHKDETGTVDQLDDAKCLSLIQKTLDAVKIEYAEVEKVLRRFYHEHV